jgi:DNA polymerase III subunit beta
MKLKILQEKLNQALVQVEKITGKDTTLPILNSILLKADKNTLNIIATNLETGVSWKLLSKIEEEGMVAMPAQMFSGLINSLPGGLVNIETDGVSVLITSDKRKSNINGLNADEFPTLPVNTNGEYLTIRADVFCQALSQVVTFTSASSVKPEITGVYLSFKKEIIKVVATDSFRLGEKTIPAPKNNTLINEYSIILPLRAVREIISIFGDKQNNINIFFTTNQITIDLIDDNDHSQPQIQFIGRLIEGDFPDYQAIIPTTSVLSVVFSKKELLNHLKSAGLFTGKNGEINIKISSKDVSLTILSQSSNFGGYESEMKLDKAVGNDIVITFNYKFLLEGLNSIKGDMCLLEFSGDDGPCVLRLNGDLEFIYILMPIKKY